VKKWRSLAGYRYLTGACVRTLNRIEQTLRAHKRKITGSENTVAVKNKNLARHLTSSGETPAIEEKQVGRQLV